MASDPRIRASDADRDRAAEALREHHATGRLSMEEFQDRLDRVYAAKTLGELDELMADLPAIDLYQLPIPAGQRFVPPRPPATRAHGRMSTDWRAAWASWACVSLICLVIWLLALGSSGAAGFWPLWVIAPWGAAMLAGWVVQVGTARAGTTAGSARSRGTSGGHGATSARNADARPATPTAARPAIRRRRRAAGPARPGRRRTGGPVSLGALQPGPAAGGRKDSR